MIRVILFSKRHTIHHNIHQHREVEAAAAAAAAVVVVVVVAAAGNPDVDQCVVVAAVDNLDGGHSILDYDHLGSRSQSPEAGGRSRHRNDLLEDGPT